MKKYETLKSKPMTKINNNETLITQKPKSFSETKIETYHTQIMIKNTQIKDAKTCKKKSQVLIQAWKSRFFS